MSFQSCKCMNVAPVFSGPEETFYHYEEERNRHFIASVCFQHVFRLELV